MKKIIKQLLLLIAVASCLFIGFVLVPYFTNTLMPWQKANAIETTLLWGGLADLPQSGRVLELKTEGSMFTRTFFLEFELPEKELDEWISSSKRLCQNTSITQDDGSKKYEIYPGEQGAVGGTVIVDLRSGIVKIKMSWS